MLRNTLILTLSLGAAAPASAGWWPFSGYSEDEDGFKACLADHGGKAGDQYAAQTIAGFCNILTRGRESSPPELIYRAECVLDDLGDGATRDAINLLVVACRDD